MGSSTHHLWLTIIFGYYHAVTVLSCASSPQAVGWRGRAPVKVKERLGLDVTSDDRAASCILCRSLALTEESGLS